MVGIRFGSNSVLVLARKRSLDFITGRGVVFPRGGLPKHSRDSTASLGFKDAGDGLWQMLTGEGCCRLKYPTVRPTTSLID